MRWPIAAAIFCLLAGWCGDGRADGCRCPPQPVRHWHSAHMVHRYRVVHFYSACPIALAREIRPGCDSHYHMVIPSS